MNNRKFTQRELDWLEEHKFDIRKYLSFSNWQYASKEMLIDDYTYAIVIILELFVDIKDDKRVVVFEIDIKDELIKNKDNLTHYINKLNEIYNLIEEFEKVVC